MTKEDILSHVVPKDCWWEDARNFTNLPERYVHKAMDLYAKQEAIGFLLDFVGSLGFPTDTHFSKGSIQDILLHLQSTVEKRYALYQQSKSKQP